MIIYKNLVKFLLRENSLIPRQTPYHENTEELKYEKEYG